MITLFIDNIEKPLDSVWYHYKSYVEGGGLYRMLIPLTEQNVIDLLESYANVKIYSPFFERNILTKDRERMSMGLIWNLYLFFNKRGYLQELNEGSMSLTINNIQKIVITDKYLELIGQVSY